MTPIVMLAMGAAMGQFGPLPNDGPKDATALASAAAAALASKCVECHGPEVAHPKGKFGFVNDLRRLVESGKYIVPGNPGESEIWSQVKDDDMPPDGAREGPLTESEKGAILAWIGAGAPMPGAGTPGASTPGGDAPGTTRSGMGEGAPVAREPAAPTPRVVERGSMAARAVVLVGRLHVVVVHFPVALLIAAGVVEAWALVRRGPAIAGATRFCLWVGATTAVVTGGLGWVHALDGFPGALADPFTDAGLHRWIGTLVGALAPCVALAAERGVRRGRVGLSVRLAVVVLGVLVGVAGHFGGLLTHGAEFMSW